MGGGGEGGLMDEMQNKAEAQPAWLQLAAGAGRWGLTELGNFARNQLTFQDIL